MFASLLGTWTLVPLLLLSGVGSIAIAHRAASAARGRATGESTNGDGSPCPQRLERANRELRLLHELARSMHTAEDLVSGLEAVLARVCETTGWTLGEAWLPDADGNHLTLEATWIPGEAPLGAWNDVSGDLELEPGVGLPGRAWATREVSWVDDIREDESLPRAGAASEVQLHAAVAIPVTEGDTVDGVLMFIVDEPRQADRQFVRLLSTVARQLAVALRRRRAEAALHEYSEELERSNEELETFANIAAHDLQEPLRDIARYVQLLEQRLDDRLEPDERDYMGFAVDGAKRLHALLNALLAYAQAGTHARDRVDASDARVAFDRVASGLADRLDAVDATLSCDPLPSVALDAHELEEVLHRLVANAVDHAGQAPHVHVTALPQGGQVTLTVSDDGVGIDPAYHDRVFELFERLERGADEDPGTGVGLAIVKRIAERHGGSVWIDGAPGEGTSVHVRLPAA